uniref:Uncharacterized protein n=1 Tax=Physcomitrium patens TaxID=3218 RepID=A0A2K1L4I9_PHYPA|nr:hypothetical protein PHYPA_003735 [Physcomitrium patens]
MHNDVARFLKFELNANYKTPDYYRAQLAKIQNGKSRTEKSCESPHRKTTIKPKSF